MSVRDTGCVGRDTVMARRTITTADGRTSFTMRMWGVDGGWDVFGTVDVNFPNAAPEGAKRAAEDALRTLCRDTLAALGDGE